MDAQNTAITADRRYYEQSLTTKNGLLNHQ